MLVSQASPDSESGRVLLYICPECGDIGCGAYSVRIEKTDAGYTWGDFAYENGYEEPRVTLCVNMSETLSFIEFTEQGERGL